MPAILFGVGIIATWIILAAGASLVSPYDPNALDFAAILAPPGIDHWMGTDHLGRDVFSRVVHATRIDLWMGIAGVIPPMVIGVLLGLVSGYAGGAVDTTLMRIVDITVAFPFFVLVIAIVGIMGPGLSNYFIALALVGWVSYARIVRANVLVLKQSDFVTACRVLGFSNSTILFRHILPNVWSPIIVYATTDAVLVILTGASLGFLGLGVQPPTPEWGAMIADGQPYVVDAWWICLFPGLAAMSLGLGLIFASDGLARRWL
jgi:peptide/nickel transport system permease protein